MLPTSDAVARGPAPGRPAPADLASASLGPLRAAGVVESVDLRRDPEAVRRGGPWFVVADFEGEARAWRFARTSGQDEAAAGPRGDPDRWRGPDPASWTSSLDETAYRAAVEDVRARIRAGEVYQANVCRVLAAPLVAPDGPGGEPDARALRDVLARGNPAPFAGHLHVPATTGQLPGWVVSASPELFLSVADGVVTSGPIKGTAAVAGGLSDKDRAENVMITDLVRNDLQRVCEPGTVEVVDLLAEEQHPGLVHLVSRVSGRLLPDVGTPLDVPALLAATFPPASVTGAPKSSALRVLRRLEPVPRGPYCGAFGWVDVERGRVELAVAIRSFWWSDGVLRFGAGAGITWGSDPQGEWDETALKARRLVALASDGREGGR